MGFFYEDDPYLADEDEDPYEWFYGRPRDTYDDAADKAGVPHNVDDRANWERVALPPAQPRPDGPVCRRCYRAAELDPYGECETCRVTAGWCSWCGTERIAYTELGLGRTCYRWLRRNEDQYEPAELEVRRRAVVARRWVRQGF